MISKITKTSFPGLLIGRRVATSFLSIHVRNGDVERLSQNFFSKFSVRAVGKKGMGFTASSKQEGLVEQAVRLAKAASENGLDNKLSEEGIASGRELLKPEKKPDVEEAVSLLKHACELMSGKKIISTDVYLRYSEVSSEYCDNTGSVFLEEYPVMNVMFCATAKQGGVVQQSCHQIGKLGGLEFLDLSKAVQSKEEAEQLLTAGLLKSGKYDVIIDPEMAGLLAHEAIGHACEADAILAGESILVNKLGEKIGSEAVTIYDDPTLPKEYGSYYLDHEGVKPRGTLLIDHGVLNSFLHSRESAGRTGTQSTGNARSESVDRMPLVRMSNTFFGPGDMGKQEMIEELKNGILLEGGNGGQVSPLNGGFQFAAVKAYEIKNGQIGKLYRNVMFSGKILETLNHVTHAGKQLGEFSPGLCGKGGQLVRVSDGGPYLTINGALLGGS